MKTSIPTSPSRPKIQKSKPRTTANRSKRAAVPKSGASSNVVSGITNYATAQRWLYQHSNYERMRVVPYNSHTFSLDRMQKLLARLGNPHHEIKFVHVAGTKGKGSTCAMLLSMLKANGFTVGMYTSPHLVDLRERITIDGQVISYADITDIFKLISIAEEELGADCPTFFEVMTAAAIRYFADQAVDIAVLETGLGGRLDATNVVTPLVCGLTHISIDHTNILGTDLASIAAEKAGVFKKNIPVVSVAQDPVVTKVFQEAANKVGSPLEYTGDHIDFSCRFEASRELGPHTRVCLTSETSRWEHLPVPLRGEHQAQNCGLALAMLDKLKNCGFSISDEQVTSGLAATTLAGRMEQVWDQPHVLIDGAHNAVSIQCLIKALGAYITYDSLVLIFGCGQDKDVRGMLKQVALGADKVIFTKAKANPRAMEPSDLASLFGEMSSKMTQNADSLEDALQLAQRAVSREDLIVVTGSFYLAGQAKKYFADRLTKQRR